MTKTYCDRCGVEAGKEQWQQYGPATVHHLVATWGTYKPTEADLCQKCAEDVDKEIQKKVVRR